MNQQEELMFIGSSPRVRGTAYIETRNKGEYRFIPACAGNSQFYI